MQRDGKGGIEEEKRDTQKTKNKMADINPNISIIALNTNRLINPSKGRNCKARQIRQPVLQLYVGKILPQMSFPSGSPLSHHLKHNNTKV